MNIDYSNKMWADIFEEMSQKGDALLDLYDSVCIVRLRQVVKWSLEEMWEIKDRAEITEAMWQDYAELEADVLAAKRMLEYFGASVVGGDQ
jgi:Mor family transcriptional regulator